jgi:hypothetical protein
MAERLERTASLRRPDANGRLRASLYISTAWIDCQGGCDGVGDRGGVALDLHNDGAARVSNGSFDSLVMEIILRTVELSTFIFTTS